MQAEMMECPIVCWLTIAPGSPASGTGAGRPKTGLQLPGVRLRSLSFDLQVFYHSTVYAMTPSRCINPSTLSLTAVA